MSVICFSALPLPHYISCGFSLAGPGRKHPERYAIGEFDLLVVMQGCLYIGEEDRHYEVSEGHALILRPDRYHYPTAGCVEKTASFWLHFHTAGQWWMADEMDKEDFAQAESHSPEGTFRMQRFDIRISQFTRLLQSAQMYECLHRLLALEKDNHLDSIRWKQQMVFQEVLMLLGASLKDKQSSSGAEIAEQAASYLRKRYKEKVTSDDLSSALNFHPVYIARCMSRHFGCSPIEYMELYRLEQAKLLLLQTDLPIGQVAREVGYQQAAYFISRFSKREGASPREYRQHYALGQDNPHRHS